MHNARLLAIAGMASSCIASMLSIRNNSTCAPTVATACDFFKQNYPNMTLLPGDTGYAAENEVSWNAGAWLGPACVLTPASAKQMSCAVKNLVKFNAPFAMRGGGHMPIADAANIDSSGILISSTNLNTLQLSEDQQTLSVGPGNRWGDAYIYLNGTQTGKMVVGGRYGPVGVPGVLLGGGMSFFSYEYGFASTNGNVRSFQCVLADGKIVEATASNEHSDLYWALQGGGNSFCLVTRFDLRTFDSPSIMLGEAGYGTGAETKDKWMDSILNYCINGSSDPKAAVIPVARFGHGDTEPEYDTTLFYNGNASRPAIFNDFQGGLLPASNSTNLSPLTMAAFAKLVTPAFQPGGKSYGIQQRFHVMSTLATKESMNIVHDTFFDAAKTKLSNVTDLFLGLAWNSITTKFIEASNSGDGCPQGVEEVPQFWVEEAYSYHSAEDDAVIEDFVQTVNANITAQLQDVGATAKYIYLNDADADQQVFQGYPAESLQRLKEIRAKYDPGMVYTNLMPGGFKVEHA